MAHPSPSTRPQLVASRAVRTSDSVRSSPAGSGSTRNHQGLVAGRRTGSANALAGNYPGLHELVEERFFPFVQQVVGFLGIG